MFKARTYRLNNQVTIWMGILDGLSGLIGMAMRTMRGWRSWTQGLSRAWCRNIAMMIYLLYSPQQWRGYESSPVKTPTGCHTLRLCFLYLPSYEIWGTGEDLILPDHDFLPGQSPTWTVFLSLSFSAVVQQSRHPASYFRSDLQYCKYLTFFLMSIGHLDDI